MSKTLKACLITCPNYMDKLKTNFSSILEKNSVPENLTVQFETQTNLFVVNSPVTHFGTEMENFIEKPDRLMNVRLVVTIIIIMITNTARETGKI